MSGAADAAFQWVITERWLPDLARLDSQGRTLLVLEQNIQPSWITPPQGKDLIFLKHDQLLQHARQGDFMYIAFDEVSLDETGHVDIVVATRWAVAPDSRSLKLSGGSVKLRVSKRLGRWIVEEEYRVIAMLPSLDVAGQRATVTDARGTTRSAYDERDRLVELTSPDGRKLLYAYDAAGNRTSLTAVVGEATLATSSTYDPLGRLDTVTDPDGRVYDHAYDANGNRTGLAHPNGVTTSYTYDDLNRLTSLGTLAAGGEAVQSYGYTLGLAGHRTAVLEHDGTTRAYTYDALYRLTGERVTGTAGRLYEDIFTYDPVGNRSRRDRTEDDVTASTVSAYDERDRLLSAGAETLTWDANGNLTSKTGPDGAAYTWDPADRLIRVEKADGTVVTHAYDADGNRVRTEITPSTGPPTVRELLVDTSGPLSHVVAETDADGKLVAYYVRGDDLLAVLRPATGPRFFHADGLGSIRALTDETGTVTDRYTFTAYGELLEHQGTDENAYLFAGEPLDPNSGFYYLRARWMDPGAGRFVGMDPFEGYSHDPITLHKYLYAGDNPVDRSDPTGRSFLSELSVSIAARITVFTMAHPVLAGIIGLTASVLVPEELQIAISQAAGPYGGPLSGIAAGEAKFFALVKSQRFRRWFHSLPEVGGRVSSAIGHAFEDFLQRRILKGAMAEVPGRNRRSYRGLLPPADFDRSQDREDFGSARATAAHRDRIGGGERGVQFCLRLPL